MAVEDYFLHRHRDTCNPEDTLNVWRPIHTSDACIQIDQADGISAAVAYPARARPGPGTGDPRSRGSGSPDRFRRRAAGADNLGLIRGGGSVLSHEG